MFLFNSVKISNYRSIGKIDIVDPRPFTVFIGSNASGKSNIIEAIEFLSYFLRLQDKAVGLFGNVENELINFIIQDDPRIKENDKIIKFDVKTTSDNIFLEIPTLHSPFYNYKIQKLNQSLSSSNIIEKNFSRIFIGQNKYVRQNIIDNSRLLSDGRNLENLLQRLFEDENLRGKVIDLMVLLVPEFKDIQIEKNALSNKEELLIFEEYSSRPFTLNLISEGTFNVLCMLAALFQSEEPQFLCIEEPEKWFKSKSNKGINKNIQV